MSRVVPPTLTLSAPDNLRPSLSFTASADRLRIETTADLTGVASGFFTAPDVYVSIPVDGFGAGASLLGFSFTQFAMPVRGTRTTPFDLNPSPTLNSPPVVVPLVVEQPDGTVALLAPLDGWHEQIFAVVQDEHGISELRWGWHGDLDELPAGTTATLGIYTDTSAAAAFARWGADVRRAAGTSRPAVADNPATSHLSYWTDNGAAYWYRTEPGLDTTTTLVTKLDELAAAGVTVSAVELDSWFYPHEISRPVSEIGYLDEVPPTGMMEWSPRLDVLPDGVHGLADALGRPPLILHARHISPASPYVEPEGWWVELTAQPEDPSFFRRWFDDAASWGACAIEVDWMVMSWFGTRGLRAAPGRALAWQHALDAAAAATGVDLIWCMPTPGDLMATVELDRVIAVRTSDDYRYAADPALLWHWYLTVNRMVGALGLPAFKDCFFSASAAEPGSDSDRADGTNAAGTDGGGAPFGVDPRADVEALLSAFSAGPAGIGDRIGRTDTELVARLCRPDGALVTSDEPIALADQSLMRAQTDDDALCWATAASGPWRYVVALHTAATAETITDRFELDHTMLVYDWRSGTATPAASIEVDVGHRDWALFVCCPIEGAGAEARALVGDTARFATMGSARVEVGDGGLDDVRVITAAAEASVDLTWWENGALVRRQAPS
ncbi:MAG: hypothetical protein AAF467_11675 [Actinomycetota bacterium]